MTEYLVWLEQSKQPLHYKSLSLFHLIEQIHDTVGKTQTVVRIENARWFEMRVTQNTSS